MIGLTLARELNKITMEELAQKLNITKQSISLWEKDGNIPLRRQKELSQILRIPENYLTKELSEIDRLIIRKIQIQNDIKDSTVTVDEDIIDEETGKVITNTQTFITNNSLLKTLDEINNEIEKLKFKDEIGSSINKSQINQYLYNKFYLILEDKKVDKVVIQRILQAIKYFYDGKDSEENNINELIGVISKIDKKHKDDLKEIGEVQKFFDKGNNIFS